MTSADHRILFLLVSARISGNAQLLARHAAQSLTTSTRASWRRLADMPLLPFEDLRHAGNGAYPAPSGHGATSLHETLAADHLVFVTPLYWYGLPAAAKLYLDHWSAWLRVPGLDFRRRMAGKTMSAIVSYSGEDPRTVEPLLGTLRLSASCMHMRWGGHVLGCGDRPGDVLSDTAALDAAKRFFLTANDVPS